MMKSAREWITVYDQRRQHPVNRRMHAIGLPLIAIGLLMLLWTLSFPTMDASQIGPLNLALLTVMACVVYAFIIAPLLAICLAGFAMVTLLLIDWLTLQGLALGPIGAALIVAGWLLIVRGQLREGRAPGPAGWIQYLPVGLLWLIARGLERLGIPW